MCEPNFNCPFCEAAFVRVDSMQSHLRQHQKLQPELEHEIFVLQQQLSQQHQSNNQPLIRPTLKRTNQPTELKHGPPQFVLPLDSKSKVAHNNTVQAKQCSHKLINTKTESKANSERVNDSNKALESIHREPDYTSSSTLLSTSIASSPTNSESEITPETTTSPVTLLISPTKSGKTFIPPGNEIQAISHENFEGLSYITVSPSTSSESTTEANVKSVIAASSKNSGDGISLHPTQTPTRLVPLGTISSRTATLGIYF